MIYYKDCRYVIIETGFGGFDIYDNFFGGKIIYDNVTKEFVDKFISER